MYDPQIKFDWLTFNLFLIDCAFVPFDFRHDVHTFVKVL